MCIRDRMQHLHIRYSGFASKKHIRDYFSLLLNYAYGDKANPVLSKNVPGIFQVDEDSNYDTIYRATSFLQQALFPFRVCAIDGNHRITSWLVLIFGHWKEGAVPKGTVIPLSTLCGEAKVQFYYTKFERKGLVNLPNVVSCTFVHCSYFGF